VGFVRTAGEGVQRILPFGLRLSLCGLGRGWGAGGVDGMLLGTWSDSEEWVTGVQSWMRFRDSGLILLGRE
jgi:hypothetical protein